MCFTLNLWVQLANESQLFTFQSSKKKYHSKRGQGDTTPTPRTVSTDSLIVSFSAS